MTAIELARQVKAMRDVQRRYFRDRKIEDMDESRRLERKLDATVREILEDRPAMLVFGDEEETVDHPSSILAKLEGNGDGDQQ